MKTFTDRNLAAERSASPGAAPAPVAVATGSTAAADLAELTQALRKYGFEHQRVPKSFAELVAAGYVKGNPTPPPGKKFEIDPKTVEVILVRQR